jgi:hypothetical protein
MGMLQCLTAACNTFSLANAKGKGMDGLLQAYLKLQEK